MKAAGLDPIKMRKGRWNAKVVHLVAILSIYILEASPSAKVRTFVLLSLITATSEFLVASFWTPWWKYWNEASL